MNDLVYFTAQVPDTSDTSVTWATGMQHECNTNKSLTQVRYELHKCSMSATRTTQAGHECYTNNTSVRRVENFDSDNNTIENIFSHPCISYMANERLQEEQVEEWRFHSKNYLSEMPCSHVKMGLKSAPQKLNFLRTKAISKS